MEELDQMFAAARPSLEAAATTYPGDAELTTRIVEGSFERWEASVAAAAAAAAAGVALEASATATTATTIPTQAAGAATAAGTTAGLGVGVKLALTSLALVAVGGLVGGVLTTREPEPAPPPVQTAAVEPQPPPRAVEPQPLPRAVEPLPSVAPLGPTVPLEPEPEPEANTASKQLSAAKMLERASRARSANDHAAAVRQYQAIVQAYPSSREASVSRVNAADLLLRQLAKPAAARRLYRAYLQRAPNGSLAEEALWGSAKACRALGDAAGERQVLEKLLVNYPSSVRAGASASRLDILRSSE